MNPARFPCFHVWLFALLLPAAIGKVHAVAPLISDVPDQVIAQNTSTTTNYFTIGDTETTFSNLVVTATSSNTNLVPNTATNLALGGSNSQRTILVKPLAGQTGATIVTLTVTDEEVLTASSAFTVTVTPPNTAPTLTGLTGHQIVGPGQTPATLNFAISDAETTASTLNVAATSSDTNLVPNVNITLGGSETNRTVQVTPVAGQHGVAVIKVQVTDPLGASAQAEFIFSVFDPTSANNAIRQPRGVYVLDSSVGMRINGVSMRDANVRDKSFVDGYVLRTEWATLEPTDGVFNFAIISNIFAKLPSNQKLSLLIGSGILPSWLNTLPGITTYTAGSPSVTRPLPWDPIAQERFRLMLVALGNYVVGGVPLCNHPRLAAIDAWIPGLKSGIRDPDEIKIRNMPGYSRTNMQNCVIIHLTNVTDNFPSVPAHIGFWTYVDNQDAGFGGVTPWEQLRQLILSEFNGTTRPRIGFWMENLAANRPAAGADPLTGLPNTGYTAPLFLSQDSAYIGYQVLGSWSRPFNSDHVDNTLNGSPEDGMDYGFTTFQCRYYEHYQADIDFTNYADEFQRWHEFLAALPLSLNFGSSQGGVSLTGVGGATFRSTLTATGGVEPYTWSVIGGSLPAGVSLETTGLLTGVPMTPGNYTFTVQVTDATGGTATQQYTLTVETASFAVQVQRNTDGTMTLTWPATIGASYQVETSTNLVNWQLLGTSVKATVNTMSWTDDGSLTGSHPATIPRRFYRVRNWGVLE